MNNKANLKVSNDQLPNGFSSIILPQSPKAPSPQKNLTGPPRIAKDIAADLYNNIQKWNDFHIKGALIVKQIAILKSDQPKAYSPQLEQYTNTLYDIVQCLMSCVNGFENLKRQCEALEKLQIGSEPLFISISTQGISNLIKTIVEVYLREFKVKELVLEHIAHSKNKNEVMFFAACWTLQPCITGDVNLKLETLLVETGHRTFH